MESAAVSSSSHLIVLAFGMNSHVAESVLAGLDPGWLRLCFRGNITQNACVLFKLKTSEYIQKELLPKYVKYLAEKP